MVTVPLLLMPPPPKAEPWAMVRALRLKVTPLFTESTCVLLPPSRVTFCPLPFRVRFFVMVSVLVMGMVPLQLNVIVSPGEALLMTVPIRPGPVSPLQSVTVRVASAAACAWRLTPATTMQRPTSSTRPRPRRTKTRSERSKIGGLDCMNGLLSQICFDLSNEVASEQARRSEGIRAATDTKPGAATGPNSLHCSDQHRGNSPNTTNNRSQPGCV